jgi:pilus assembly protein Flp/PilA
MELLNKMIRHVAVAQLRLKSGLRLEREEGQAMVEYGLIIALIAAVVITVVVLLGNDIKTAFSSITNQL